MTYQSTAAASRPLTMQDVVSTEQLALNQESASVYLQAQTLKLHRETTYLFLVGFGSAVVYIVASVLKVKADYKDMIDFIDSATSWTGRPSGLSVALAAEWNWYNYMFGPSGNKVFPMCVRLAWYNKSYRCLMCSQDPGAFLYCLWQEAESKTNSSDSALSILCAAFNINDPSNSLCNTQCPPFAGYAPSALYSIGSGALGGAAAGSGAGLALGAAAGPWGLAIGAAIGIAGSLYQRSQQQKKDQATCQNQDNCFLPQGACSNVN